MSQIGACEDLMDDTMFPNEEAPADIYALQVAVAKGFCSVCPGSVKMDCLVGALERGERYGVWGGADMLTEREGLIDLIKGITKGQAA